MNHLREIREQLADDVLRRIATRYKDCEVNIYPDFPELSPVKAVLRCAMQEGFVLTSKIPESQAETVGESEFSKTLNILRESPAAPMVLSVEHVREARHRLLEQGILSWDANDWAFHFTNWLNAIATPRIAQAETPLRELVEKWRRIKEDKLAVSIFGFSTTEVLNKCADELEAVLAGAEEKK
jgi:hypothetical protein